MVRDHGVAEGQSARASMGDGAAQDQILGCRWGRPFLTWTLASRSLSLRTREQGHHDVLVQRGQADAQIEQRRTAGDAQLAFVGVMGGEPSGGGRVERRSDRLSSWNSQGWTFSTDGAATAADKTVSSSIMVRFM